MSVQMVWLVTHTRRAVFWIVNQVNVAAIKIVLIHWPAFKEHALAHAKAYCAVKMPIANQKIMLLGVDAALALLKMNMANVYHVCYFITLFPLEFHEKLQFFQRFYYSSRRM